MATTKLFNNWTWSLPLPEPFKGSKSTSTDPDHCSKYNDMAARKATLHAPTLRAILYLIDIYDGDNDGALGLKKESGGDMGQYHVEMKTSRGRNAVHYNANNGKFKACIKEDATGAISRIPALKEGESDGKPLLLAAAFTSGYSKSKVYNEEFNDNFTILQECKRDDWRDMGKALKVAFVCCDNLYRRIENGKALGSDGFPYDVDTLSSGNTPQLTQITLDGNSPSETVKGTFQLFTGKAKSKPKRKRKTIGEIGDEFRLDVEVPDGLKAMVPDYPGNYAVSPHVYRILMEVKYSKKRNFLIRGEAGTGKSTDARIMAQLLGLPYYYFNCSEGTDELELVSSVMPNTTAREAKPEMELPSFDDLMMDPGTALSKLTGEYEELSEGDSFHKILEATYRKGYERAKDEGDFVTVESSVVAASRRAALIELQEPSVIRHPGTLSKLNSLLDDCGSITLSDGTVVKRDPNTVVVLTTNTDYAGCYPLNQALISRMNAVVDVESLKPADMVKRFVTKFGCKQEPVFLEMAKAVMRIQEFCRNELITDGVCGYREFEDWLSSYLLDVEGGVLEAAKFTVLGKATNKSDARKDIFDSCLKTHFEEAA